MESTLRRNRSARNNYGRRRKNSVEEDSRVIKIVRQIILSVTILVIALTIKNIDSSFTNYISNRTVQILNADTQVSTIVESVKGFISKLNITNEKLKSVFNGYDIKLDNKVNDQKAVPLEFNENIFDHTLLANIQFQKPLEGILTSGFGNRINPITNKKEFHFGIDISAPEGEDIKSVLDGVVMEVGSNNSLGNYVKIRHSNDLKALYAHTSFVNVGEGELVNKGDVIAKVGSTGLANGPHLHFELWNGEKVINSEKIFNYQDSEVVYN